IKLNPFGGLAFVPLTTRTNRFSRLLEQPLCNSVNNFLWLALNLHFKVSHSFFKSAPLLLRNPHYVHPPFSSTHHLPSPLTVLGGKSLSSALFFLSIALIFTAS
ncbi:hypothetical protein AB1I98_24660, partial [Enterococcus avium]